MTNNDKLRNGKNYSNKSTKGIIVTDNDMIDEEWMQAINKNPVFDFLKDEQKDVYSLDDGKSYSGNLKNNKNSTY